MRKCDQKEGGGGAHTSILCTMGLAPKVAHGSCYYNILEYIGCIGRVSAWVEDNEKAKIKHTHLGCISGPKVKQNVRASVKACSWELLGLQAPVSRIMWATHNRELSEGGGGHQKIVILT